LREYGDPEDEGRPFVDSHRSYHPRRGVAYLTVVAVLAAALVGTGSAAHAGPRDDARRAQAAVARAASALEGATARAQLAGRRLAETAAALPGAQQAVIDAQGRVIAAEVAASTARRHAEAAQAGYDAAEARFTAAQARVDEARVRLEDLAAQSYMTSNLTNFNFVMGAGGALDALDRLSYVDRVMSNQQATIEELGDARWTARIAQDEAGGAKRAADEAKAEAEASLGRAESAQRAALKARADLVALTALRRDAATLARSERAASLALYEAAQEEETRIAAQLRAWQGRGGSSAGPGLRPGARLLMPVNVWKSSDYGMRLNPVYGVWRMHAGMDIAAAGGAPIRAAADGVVIRAGWSGGYGKYTCVGHGRSVSTCYGHQSEITVSSGQHVRRGQLIGRVGTTGASTGYHLHFEVRVDGDPRDPEKWLPSCLC
jgi:murein DD-endopeptidase MepM/ murein hydrolase activator NlpD